MKMTTKLSIKLPVIALCLVVSGIAQGDDERPDHFKGKPARTLDEAVANFSEYNDRLAALLEKELSPQDAHQVHELTYTLENALEKIRSEFSELSTMLENVHVASEHADVATIKTEGKAYLDSARKAIK